MTGKPLDARSADVKAYDKYTADLSAELTKRAEKAAPGLVVRSTYAAAFGGVAAVVPANQIGALLKTDGIAAVQEDTLEHPLDDNTSFIGATTVWPTLGGSANAGSNVIVGDIDTGVWPEHPMLAHGHRSARPPAACRGCQFGDGADAAHLGPPFACNNKLIGAYAFTATYMANHRLRRPGVLQRHDRRVLRRATPRVTARTPRRPPPATASPRPSLYGVERGPVCGIAPGARVIEYRVCLSAGLLRAPTRSPPSSRRSSTASTSSTSRSRVARNPYTRPGRARVPRRDQRRHLRQRRRPATAVPAPGRPITAARG